MVKYRSRETNFSFKLNQLVNPKQSTKTQPPISISLEISAAELHGIDLELGISKICTAPTKNWEERERERESRGKIGGNCGGKRGINLGVMEDIAYRWAGLADFFLFYFILKN